MPQQQPARHRHHRLGVAILATASILAVAGIFGSPATAQTSKRVVSEAHNPSLGKTVLTADNGLTLYSLSAEVNGRFICKGSCLKDWHPLVVAKGVKPTGPVALGTIKRPDSGRRQVTFDGRPLYTFDADSRKGDANGEGIKDVGTWHAATP
jgi:predicted lipoprotein with Yx(FWY)xxD motif